MNVMSDRIVSVFISFAKNHNSMDFEEFVKTMAKFKSTSGQSAEEKMKLVFNL